MSLKRQRWPFKFYTCSFRRVCLRTCGVQFTSRGTGRSAEQSGASAGCCGCRNMTVRVKNLKHIFGKWPSHRPPHDHYNFNGNMLKRSGLEWSSSLLVWLFSMVKMTFRKFVYRFPPLSSNIQLALNHFPPYSLSLHCVPRWCFLTAPGSRWPRGWIGWKQLEGEEDSQLVFFCAKGVNRARWAGGRRVGSYHPPLPPDGCHLDLQKNPQMSPGMHHFTVRFIARVK